MEAKKSVALLRKIRHDFGNHLQVLSGYLELHQPDKAQEYVNKLILALRAEQKVFQIAEDEAAIYLFEQLLAARDLGVRMQYKEVDINSYAALIEANEPLKTISLLRQENKADELSVEVVIGHNREQDIYVEYYSEAFAVNPHRVVIKE